MHNPSDSGYDGTFCCIELHFARYIFCQGITPLSAYKTFRQKRQAAALAYLQHNPAVDQKRLGIYGSSMGSMTAIHAAAHHTEARFLYPDEFDQRLIAFFDKALR